MTECHDLPIQRRGRRTFLMAVVKCAAKECVVQPD